MARKMAYQWGEIFTENLTEEGRFKLELPSMLHPSQTHPEYHTRGMREK